MGRNKYPEQTQERIVEASVKLFIEKGYDQTTITPPQTLYALQTSRTQISQSAQEGFRAAIAQPILDDRYYLHSYSQRKV